MRRSEPELRADALESNPSSSAKARRPAWLVGTLVVTLGGCSDGPAPNDASVDAPAVDAPTVDAAIDAAIDGGGPCDQLVTPEECRPHFEGLSAPVEIVRDADGVPHVYGETDADTFYGDGYMMATDRLLQMELARRQALGRRAELFGEGAVDGDVLLRRMRIGYWGDVNASLLAREDPARYRAIEGWVAGVNRRIAEIDAGTVETPYGFGPAELDFVPEPWTVGHALAIAKLLLFGNSNQIQFDILATVVRRYFPDLWAILPLYTPLRDAHQVPPEERPSTASAPIPNPLPGAPTPRLVPASRPALPPDAAERLHAFFHRFDDFRGLSVWHGASNNWAVDGVHTENGRPLIAGDPHQGFSSPNIFWLHHLHSADPAGGVDVVGWSFAGTPAVQLGHNRRVAWTATTTYPDVMDLWGVRVSADTVTLAGTTVPIEHIAEQVLVNDGEPVDVDIEWVPGYGVLLPSDLAPIPVVNPGERLLFNWIGFAPTHEALGFGLFDVSSTIDEFEHAVDQMEIGTFNFVAADATGITYRSSPATPARRGAVSDERAPWALLDGDDVDSFWDGILPLSQMPHSRGGTRGWLATANNEPFGFNDDGIWTNNPYYFGVYFDPGTRAARIESELERLVERPEPVTPEDLEAIQDDTYSILADDFLPPLIEAWDARATDDALVDLRDREDLATLVELLRDWDRRMERDSSAAVVANAYEHFLVRRLLQDDFGLVFDPIFSESPMYLLKITSFCLRRTFDAADSFFQDGRSATIVAALVDTADFLTAQFGSVDPAGYTWGAIHGAVFGSIYGAGLEVPFVATDGANGTVNVAETRFFDGTAPRTRLEAGGGSVYRAVTDFAEDGTPVTRFQMPRGVSGNPDSPHYGDLQDDWVVGRYRPLRFERTDVETDASETMTLTP